MRRWIVFLWISAEVVILFFSFQAKDSFALSESFGVQKFPTKREAPPFSLKDLNGNEMVLADYKGKPLLIFFWGSFCPACKEDIVLLQKFVNSTQGQLAVLTIAIDGEKESRIKRLVKDLKITLPILLDRKERLARIYGLKMIPTTFLIGREGFVEGMIVGQRDWCGIDALTDIKELLDLR